MDNSQTSSRQRSGNTAWQIIGRLVVSAIVLGITAFFTPGFSINNIWSLAVAAIVLTVMDYLIVKFPNCLTIGSFGCSKDEIYTFNNIDELYNTTIDNICLKDDWNSITDILIDLTFSVIDDKNIIKDLYQVSL